MKKILFSALLLLCGAALTAQTQTPNRPQEPKPPFPYHVEDVTFENPTAGITLAGTITKPLKGKRFPTVVLLTGSGSQDRNEELFGHKPFMVLADHLTRRGIAVLRFDDRDVGGSGKGSEDATVVDLAGDALAAIDYLSSRGDVDPRRIGLAGHSMGAEEAFIAAAQEPAKVAFVVSMAGAGVKMQEISVMQVEDIARAQGMSAPMAKFYADKKRDELALYYGNTAEFVASHIDSLAGLIVPDWAAQPAHIKEHVLDAIKVANSPSMRHMMNYDLAPDLARVKCPVLAVNGSKDVQVRASANLPALRQGLAAGGNALLTKEYEGLNHLFQSAKTGNVDEYGSIEETFSPLVMEDIAVWILKNSK